MRSLLFKSWYPQRISLAPILRRLAADSCPAPNSSSVRSNEVAITTFPIPCARNSKARTQRARSAVPPGTVARSTLSRAQWRALKRGRASITGGFQITTPCANLRFYSVHSYGFLQTNIAVQLIRRRNLSHETPDYKKGSTFVNKFLPHIADLHTDGWTKPVHANKTKEKSGRQ